MPELRKDPIADRWVIMAPERAKRPIQLSEHSSEQTTEFDPFAEGNEAETPPEIFALRHNNSAANGPGWRVRVVPNRYPAVQCDASLSYREEGLYELMDGFGAHEVIIECPHNESNISRLDDKTIGEILWVYRSRLADLKHDKRLVHATIFKNKGLLAGASLHHAHSQLIAGPLVPPVIREKLSASRAYFERHHRSLFADLLQQELTSGTRIVQESTHFVAFCPYASRFAYETWLLPKRPISHFEELTQPETDELGHMLKLILRTLEVALGDPPYNYIIHTAPFDQPALPYFSWHIELFPRITRVAGFEWGSGSYINTVLPEAAAQMLRDCQT